MTVIWNALAIVIAIAAFGFSLFSYIQQRSKDRQDLFLRIHEQLISPAAQNGRRLLNSIDRTPEDFALLRESDLGAYQSINLALAWFEVLTMYVERGYVSKDLVLEEWGQTIARSWTHGVPFIKSRVELEGFTPWHNLIVWGPKIKAWVDKNRPYLLSEADRARLVEGLDNH